MKLSSTTYLQLVNCVLFMIFWEFLKTFFFSYISMIIFCLNRLILTNNEIYNKLINYRTLITNVYNQHRHYNGYSIDIDTTMVTTQTQTLQWLQHRHRHYNGYNIDIDTTMVTTQTQTLPWSQHRHRHYNGSVYVYVVTIVLSMSML